LFTVESMHLALYTHCILGLPEPVVEHFGKTIALLAVYPYVGELVQSLTSRAGVPPLTLGLLRVSPPGLVPPAP